MPSQKNLTFSIQDDGTASSNAALPASVYKGALDLRGADDQVSGAHGPVPELWER